MYQVIVVDDEPVALEHICEIIKKKCPEFEVIGTAENGEDGLKLVALQQPDLLISDVKMPLLDGIGLVSQVKAQYPMIFSIIVSGYSDFEYAKGALQSEVCDYILKPVIPSSMKKTLDSVAQKIKRNHYQQRNRLIHQLCSGGSCHMEEMVRYFPCETYNCAVIRRNGLPRRFSAVGSLEVFSDIQEQFTVYGRDEMEALYIIPHDMLCGKSFEDYLRSITEKLKTEREYITTVYKRQCFPVHELPNIVKSLYSSLDAKSIVGKHQFIENSTDGGQTAENFDYDTIYAGLRNLERMLREQQYEKAKKELLRLYTHWTREEKTQLWLEHVSRQILYLIRKYSENPQPLLECEYMVEDAFFYAVSLEELTEGLLDIMFKYVPETTFNTKLDSPDFMRTVEAYMEKHLSEPLSMQSVCRNFAVSQPYLGKLFRKYKNQSFNHYLTGIRMERATRLMKENPDIYIKDVAALVGYEDQFYFSRIFRSYTGMCPSDYYCKSPAAQ